MYIWTAAKMYGGVVRSCETPALKPILEFKINGRKYDTA
jgi:hypothetical protein